MFPWQEGKKAFEDGEPVEANPYSDRDIRWLLWLWGWYHQSEKCTAR